MIIKSIYYFTESKMNPEKKKNIMITILISALIMIYYAVYFAILVTILEGIWKLMFGILPLILSYIMLRVCVERINEIKKGEDDDFSKY